jgi:hypothetical protein
MAIRRKHVVRGPTSLGRETLQSGSAVRFRGVDRRAQENANEVKKMQRTSTRDASLAQLVDENVPKDAPDPRVRALGISKLVSTRERALDRGLEDVVGVERRAAASPHEREQLWALRGERGVYRPRDRIVFRLRHLQGLCVKPSCDAPRTPGDS